MDNLHLAWRCPKCQGYMSREKWGRLCWGTGTCASVWSDCLTIFIYLYLAFRPNFTRESSYKLWFSIGLNISLGQVLTIVARPAFLQGYGWPVFSTVMSQTISSCRILPNHVLVVFQFTIATSCLPFNTRRGLFTQAGFKRITFKWLCCLLTAKMSEGRLMEELTTLLAGSAWRLPHYVSQLASQLFQPDNPLWRLSVSQSLLAWQMLLMFPLVCFLIIIIIIFVLII